MFRLYTVAEKSQPIQIVSGPSSDGKKRFSLGLDLAECTLDCSIELCDSSAATSMQDSSPLQHYKAHSHEMEESLGILTPDQMIEFLDTNASYANLEMASSLPLALPKHKCQVDHTPSPEELPLDPIEVKTFDTSDMNETVIHTTITEHDAQSQCDSYTRTDQMSKSTTSKTTAMATSTVASATATSNSFITSVTSIASLDNGYQGDGEMSRPASRGAENSPMRRVNSRQNKLHTSDSDNVPVVRRQDPMTDSDFFTESDADDVFHRGDRRVQIIDGHMYNAQGADMFIDEQPNIESSGMDSSGIYTDVEQPRTEDDMQSLAAHTMEHSDNSPNTVKSPSNVSDNNNRTLTTTTDLDIEKSAQTSNKPWSAIPTQSAQSIGTLSNSSSTTINDSTATTYLCGASSDGARANSSNSNNGFSSSSSGGGGSSGTSGGDTHSQQNTVISEPYTKSNAKAARSHQSTSRSSDDEQNKVSHPALKTPPIKTKKLSPNRKQAKSNADSSKRCDVKSEKSPKSARNRSMAKCQSPESASTSSTVDTSLNAGGIVVHVRKNTPNKWDAVMNKIAANKANDAKSKNYNEVKSKVTCGLKRGSPALNKTPASEQSIASDSGVSSVTTTKSPTLPLTRQSTFGVTKRYV